MELFWKEIFGALGSLLGLLVIFLVTRYVIPWLKVKLGESKYYYILTFVQSFMAAVEAEMPDGHGEEKAEWVTDRVLEIFPKLNREYVKALIDGSMRALTQDGLINYSRGRAD